MQSRVLALSGSLFAGTSSHNLVFNVNSSYLVCVKVGPSPVVLSIG